MQLQIGVKVIIKNSSDRYFLVRRSELLPGDTETSWDIPGGRINPDESLDQALAREVKEEINATLSGKPILLAAQDIFVPAKNSHVVRLTYLLLADIDAITLSNEHQTHRWVTLPEALRLNVEPYLKKTLESLGDA